MFSSEEDRKSMEKLLKEKKHRIDKINEAINTLIADRDAQEQEYKLFNKMLLSSSSSTMTTTNDVTTTSTTTIPLFKKKFIPEIEQEQGQNEENEAMLNDSRRILVEDDNKSESMYVVSLDQEEEAQRREMEKGLNEDGKINNIVIDENNSDIGISSNLDNFLPAFGRSSTETFIIERHNTTSDSDNNNEFYSPRKYFFSPPPDESDETSTVTCDTYSECNHHDDNSNSVSINSSNTQSIQYPENNNETITITNVRKNTNIMNHSHPSPSVSNCKRYFDSLISTPSSSAKSQNSENTMNNNNNSSSNNDNTDDNTLKDDISFTSSNSPSLLSPNIIKSTNKRKQQLVSREPFTFQAPKGILPSSSSSSYSNTDTSRMYGASSSSTTQKMKLDNKIDANSIFSSLSTPRGNSSKVTWNNEKAQSEHLILKLQNRVEKELGDEDESEVDSEQEVGKKRKKASSSSKSKSSSPTKKSKSTPKATTTNNKKQKKVQEESEHTSEHSDNDDDDQESSPAKKSTEEEDEEIEMGTIEGKSYQFNENDYVPQNLQVLEIDISIRIKLAISKNRELNLEDLDQSPVSCREQEGEEYVYLHKICVSASVCTKKARGMIHKRQATISLKQCVDNSYGVCSTNRNQRVLNGKNATLFTHLARDLFLIGPTWAFFSMHCRTRVRQFINNYNYIWSACKMVSAFETLDHHKGIASIVWQKFKRWMLCVMSDEGVKREIESQAGSQAQRKSAYSETMPAEELAGSEYAILGKIGNRPRYPLCSVCGVKVDADYLRTHERDQHNVYNYNCNKCGLFFRSFGVFKSHTKEHIDNPDVPFSELVSSAEGIMSSHQFAILRGTTPIEKIQEEKEKKKQEEQKKKESERRRPPTMEEMKNQVREKDKKDREIRKQEERQIREQLGLEPGEIIPTHHKL